jgi:CRP/FNR family transcriptional regulator, cyclic AMP receptor protein
MIIQGTLVASGLFREVGVDAAARFTSELTLVYFPRRSVVYAQSDPSDDRLYLIVTGKVKATTRLPTDDELILTVFGPAEFFGLVSAFDLERRETSATALTDVHLLCIERELITSWVMEHPQIGLQLLRILARRTRKLTVRLCEEPLDDSPRLVAKRLVQLAQSFGAQEGESVRVTHEMTINELAQFAGGRLGAVASALGSFGRRGWIVLGGGSLVIRDMEQLINFAYNLSPS